MKILITGGLGFIGSHTADALLAQGHTVRILDNVCEPVHIGGKPNYIPAGSELIRGDVRNKSDWEKALQGIEVVYHFAAYQDYNIDFSRFFATNVVGTSLLYEVAVEKKLSLARVIVASSQAVYGEGKYLCKTDGVFYPELRTEKQLMHGEWEHSCPTCGPSQTPQWQTTDETKMNPQNQYGLSKQMQETLALNLGKRYGIPTVALRYSIVQGPRQSFTNAYSGACRVFCLSYFLKKEPPIFEDGLQLRDYVNINDVVDANVLVLNHPKVSGEAFNVGGGKASTVLEFAKLVAKKAGRDFNPKFNHSYRFGDTRHIVSDIAKLKGLGWAPQRGIETSIEHYLEWLSGFPNLKDTVSEGLSKMRTLNIIRSVQS